MQWTLVVPAKTLPAAKSRLAPATSGPDQHRDLVEAIRWDTLEAARAAAGVARVVVVTDRLPSEVDPLIPGDPRQLVVQRSPGLNGAIRDAAEHARELWPLDGIAALVGDLPALREQDLVRALRSAARVPAGFVPDASGSGTTLLTARPEVRLHPLFGTGSASRHAEQATRLDAGASLRCDVDTIADLEAALLLGVGRHTARCWERLGAGRVPGVHDGVA